MPSVSDLSAFAIDGVVPKSVDAPSGRTSLARMLRQASADNLAVFPRGGGTQMALGNRPERVDLVVDLTRLSRVLDYQPADMTVTVEAGITLSVLQEELASAGKYVPLEAPYPERATIGGVLSAAPTGPLAHAYGPPRDWLIGIGVVGPDGIETKAGGKVVKNVTGYDLNRLYTGALGTLGVIVEATFKVAPIQPENSALVGYFPTLAESIEAGTALLDSPAAPMAYLATYPQHGSLLSHLASVACGIAFYSGRAQATKRRVDDSSAALKQAGARDISLLDETGARELCQQLTNMAWNPDRPPSLAVKVAAPRRETASLAAACVEIGGAEVVADPGFGGLRLYWWDAPAKDAALRYIDAARGAATNHGGMAVVERVADHLKGGIDVWGEEPDSFAIMRRIKEQFDPAGLLNPGRGLGRL